MVKQCILWFYARKSAKISATTWAERAAIFTMTIIVMVSLCLMLVAIVYELDLKAGLNLSRYGYLLATVYTIVMLYGYHWFRKSFLFWLK